MEKLVSRFDGRDLWTSRIMIIEIIENQARIMNQLGDKIFTGWTELLPLDHDQKAEKLKYFDGRLKTSRPCGKFHQLQTHVNRWHISPARHQLETERAIYQWTMDSINHSIMISRLDWVPLANLGVHCWNWNFQISSKIVNSLVLHQFCRTSATKVIYHLVRNSTTHWLH